MTKEETKRRFKAWCQRTIGNYCSDEDEHMFNNIMTLLDQSSDEDLISRKALMEEIGKPNALDGMEDSNIFAMFYMDLVKKSPSATPQQKHGKWIRRVGITDLDVYFECSECGRKLNCLVRDDFYCSKCGSDNSDSVKDWFDKWDSKIAKMEAEHEQRKKYSSDI